MFPVRTVSEELLREIDGTVLDERRIRWKEAVKNAPYTMLTDRQKYATEAWKETEGEDLELRRAKMVKKIAENVAIDILDYDYIVGRIGPYVVGNYTEIDIVATIWRACGVRTASRAPSTTGSAFPVRTWRSCGRPRGPSGTKTPWTA